MMGKKKRSTLRDEVYEALEKATGDPTEWLEREIRKAERKPKVDEREIETLRMLRDALAEASQTVEK